MKKKHPLRTLTIACLVISFLLPACKKEGVGGDATIRGYIKAEKWNSTFTQYIGSYPAKDVDVFIQYDDSYGYDDRTRTDYHGYFEFPFLYKGRYHIYAYSRDSTGRDLSGEVPVIRDIDIRQRMETVDLDTLVIFE